MNTSTPQDPTQNSGTTQTSKNKGIANLKPGNRKGTTGTRKKLTKPLLERLGQLVDDNFSQYEQTLALLFNADPVTYEKAFRELVKLIIVPQMRGSLDATADDAGGFNLTINVHPRPQELPQPHTIDITPEATISPMTTGKVTLDLSQFTADEDDAE